MPKWCQERRGEVTFFERNGERPNLRKGRGQDTTPGNHVPSYITPALLEQRYTECRNRYYLLSEFKNIAGGLDYFAMHPHFRYKSASENLAQMRALTPEFVREVAARYLSPDTIRFAYLGSEEALRAAGVLR